MSDFIMNERLRFSWAHIIAFIALIAVSYTSFVGFTYLSNGSFISGSIGMVMTDIVFIFVFIGAQQLKASGENMRNKITWERILIFGSPFVFIAGMIAISHFWTVQTRNDEVVTQFNGAMQTGSTIFDEYEKYANERIDNYDKNLNNIIANKNSDLFRKAGFTSGDEKMQKENMVEVLKLQLMSSNYDSLKNLATKWMEKANNGASTANVFLLGNTREIREALIHWEEQLKGFSERKLSNEELSGKVTTFQSNSGTNAAAQLDGMSESFTKQHIPTVGAIIFGVVIYLMLIFPYFLQERHSKSVYSLSSGNNPVKPKHKKPIPPRPMMGPDGPGNFVERPMDEGDFPSF